MEPFFDPLLGLGLAHLAPALTHGARVLEIGSGRGELARCVADAGPAVVSLDIDAERLGTMQADARPSRVRADAGRLPFRNDVFDAVYSVSVLQYLDWRSASREVRRVLRPGGRAFFLENLAGHPAARAYRLLRRFAWSYPAHLSPVHHVTLSECHELTRGFASARVVTAHLLTPAVLLRAAFDMRRARTRTPWMTGIVFRKLAAVDRRLMRLWPGFAGWCWHALLLVQREPGG